MSSSKSLPALPLAAVSLDLASEGGSFRSKNVPVRSPPPLLWVVPAPVPPPMLIRDEELTTLVDEATFGDGARDEGLES